ncbi:SDR family oxidoreductase [Thiohalophilus sp.]|uniref:SDR family oxidoreductase n=1 Tax=Thiohalophilus sp. TaxID=3028392 RepID=UPI002ACD6D96|nr:SDR family oxidoreductase [Thiohalophilus sp.]MDZ7661901.1 SDR family oxidoreductase [Thiohalophilus sp.]MDZ7803768.1 SDR family oxidoreductase [Thiohalophilus sp.]
MKRILILGATSAIAEQTARLYADRGAQLMLAARDKDKLQRLADDLNIRGSEQVDWQTLDLNDTSEHENLLINTEKQLGGLDMVLIAYGTLGEQAAGERDFNLALEELKTNCLSVLSFLTLIANRFEAQQSGTIAVISSVAGDRGRQSNYIYGTAKGALTIFLQGLRNRLHKAGVQVLTIKPGFVDTPMTREFEKGLLWVKPQVIAAGIVRAVDRRKDVVYLPFFWRYIMLIIKLIPEFVFKRLSL